MSAEDDKSKSENRFPGGYNCLKINARGTIILASIYKFRKSLPIIVAIAHKLGMSEKDVEKKITLSEINIGDKLIELPFEWYVDCNPKCVHEYLDRISGPKHSRHHKVSEPDCLYCVFQLDEHAI